MMIIGARGGARASRGHPPALSRPPEQRTRPPWCFCASPCVESCKNANATIIGHRWFTAPPSQGWFGGDRGHGIWAPETRLAGAGDAAGGPCLCAGAMGPQGAAAWGEQGEGSFCWLMERSKEDSEPMLKRCFLRSVKNHAQALVLRSIW
jgi:hypothetical protein